MTHPTDVDRPDEVELDSFGDREEGDKLTEYVRFIAEPSVDESVIEGFADSLEQDCDDSWTVSVSGSPDGEVLIELHTVHHDFSEEPPLPDDVRREMEEAEGEYYRKMDEAERDF